ncbi:MAG: divergent PAP2 family protein [Candidatus Dormibacterales bacterium]
MSWRYILPPVVAWFIAQVFKVAFESMRERRLDLRILASMGGMPSSHSAMVMALTAAVARIDGVGSATFSIALMFSLVVMYDAAGVRRAVGRQAAILNRIVDDVLTQRQGIREERLRELLGHTPVQVLAGAALGILVGLAWP